MREVVHGVLARGDGGMIAVGPDAVAVLDFNSEGMFRAVVDSTGRFEIGIR